MSKYHEKASSIVQSDHNQSTPTALLARILALEEKVNGKPAKPAAPAKK